MISAITVAYLRHHTAPALAPTVPVVACPRGDLVFRPETVTLLELSGVPREILVHVDEVDLEAPMLRGDLALTLTDHNEGSLQDKASLGGAVVEVLDHHKDGGAFPHLPPEKRRIEFGEAKGYPAGRGMGSACTLVCERYLEEAPELLDLTVGRLLGAVILLDTNNLLNDGKVTQRDKDAARVLFEIPGMPDQTELYDQLQGAKSDPAYWSQVATYDLLKSDFKGFEVKGRVFGIASINGGAGDLVELLRTRGALEVQEAFERYAKVSNSEALLAMCCYPSPEAGWDQPRRDLMVYCPDGQLREAIAAYLEEQDALQLLKVEDSGLEQLYVYRQQNVKSSRKQLQPLMHAFYQAL